MVRLHCSYYELEISQEKVFMAMLRPTKSTKHFNLENFICYISGGADLISIAPTYIGHSSPCEIKAYQTLANSNGGSLGGKFPDDLMDSYSGDDASEVLEWSSLELAPTYPCKPSYSTITVHNYR